MSEIESRDQVSAAEWETHPLYAFWGLPIQHLSALISRVERWVRGSVPLRFLEPILRGTWPRQEY